MKGRVLRFFATLSAIGLCSCSTPGASPAVQTFAAPPGANRATENAAPVIAEFRGSPINHSPYYVTLGPDGNEWFSESIDPDFGAQYLDRITPDGTRKRFIYYSSASSQYLEFPSIDGITTGSDGNLWLTDQGDGVVSRMTTTGAVTVFVLPGPIAAPQGIVNGPDANLWFCDNGNNSIDQMSTQGRLNIYAHGLSANAGLWQIASGPDGNLWFTERTANRIGRMSTGGTVVEFSSGISSDAGLGAIAAGSDGALWFTEKNAVGRITTSGVVTEFRTGISQREHPIWIASGPNRALWFTEQGPKAMLGRITTRGVITEFDNGITHSHAALGAIARGAGGTMWFTEVGPNRIARVTL